jgi:hypothetical protein
MFHCLNTFYQNWTFFDKIVMPTKNKIINTIKKHFSIKSYRLVEYIILAFAVFGFGLVVALTPPTQHLKVTSSQHKPTLKPVKKIATPAPAPPKPATVVTTPAPAVTTPTPVSITPTPQPKVEPVVKPAPSSSVSGLTPTSTTTPSTSSTAPTTTSSPTPSSSTSTTTSYTSTNWSGYLAVNGNFTEISSSWTATSPTGNGSTMSADATWIGIGGVTTSDLIQIGTDNAVSASGQVSASAFYELLPNASIDISSINVSPGDQMTASLSEVSASLWDMTITDTTKNQTFTEQVSYSSSNSSAEWIEEDPSYSNGQLIPLDNFKTASFTNATTVSSGSTLNLATANAQPITLVNSSGQPIATPSSIGSDGASFSVNQD